MRRNNTSAMISLAVLGLLFAAASTANPWFPETAPRSSVDLCVTEIAGYADYTDATRVRHDIESRERRSVGHILRINTRVYGGEDGTLVREYATECTVGKGAAPVRFLIHETAIAS